LALTSLERALLLAQPEGYVRIFVEEGECVRLLLSDFRLTTGVRQDSRIDRLTNGQSHLLLAYVDKLLSAFGRVVEQPSTALPKKTDLIESLSERELEVLRLVAQGLTNDEISQRLVLALSTVKGHNLRIFAKLQARNRSEAVARARELGLL
jgi:LuxR family maltose regulon positive regulatory protein